MIILIIIMIVLVIIIVMIMIIIIIIFVPAKRATCWQRNARDRATGHRHYTRCCCAGGCAHFSLTAASSSSTPISFGCFRKLSSVAHFHFCNTRGLSSDGCWWHSKFQPSGSPRVFTGYVMTHALPGLGSHRCSNSWAHIIRGISQVLFGQEGLLLSFPTWQNNLGGMGGDCWRGGGGANSLCSVGCDRI